MARRRPLEAILRTCMQRMAAEWREDFGRLRNAVQAPMHAPLTPPEDVPEPSPPPDE